MLRIRVLLIRIRVQDFVNEPKTLNTFKEGKP